MIPVSICVSYVWHTAKMHNAIQYRYNIPFRIRELTSSQRGDPIGNRPFIPRRARRYIPLSHGATRNTLRNISGRNFVAFAEDNYPSARDCHAFSLAGEHSRDFIFSFPP